MTTPTESWQDDFDKLFVRVDKSPEQFGYMREWFIKDGITANDIMDYITNLLASTHQQAFHEGEHEGYEKGLEAKAEFIKEVRKQAFQEDRPEKIASRALRQVGEECNCLCHSDTPCEYSIHGMRYLAHAYDSETKMCRCGKKLDCQPPQTYANPKHPGAVVKIGQEEHTHKKDNKL